jgi:hypothetical protein
MDLNKAAMLEDMLVISRDMLQGLADHVRDSVPVEQRREMLIKIGTAMTELLDISWMLHAEHPALNPYPEETRLGAEIRARAAVGKKGD